MVKVLNDELAYEEVPVRDDDIIMTLLESFPGSFKNLITAMEENGLGDGAFDAQDIKAQRKKTPM